ncbi:unnamed protein product [Nesidiocoris tenuis]|uniref:Carboxylesterase type B domain-containing protein n=1 Tax=Nesidiocoris tenuis TaxID=355587 RepID=A0A6H5GYG0_9HEMI|nr:unnamed protein product [Nesidiocoris tenuis]
MFASRAVIAGVKFVTAAPPDRRVTQLLHRVVLLSGSGLSPWALQKDPLGVTRRVAEKTGCHGELLEEDIAPCLRSKPLRELMAVHLDPPRFLPGFAPFADGAVLSSAMSSQVMDSGLNSQERHGPAYLLSDFPDRDLFFGVTSTESYLDLSAQDLEYGFNETRRDRILRTYVRNSYYFHLNEIFSTLKNEYTDWDRPVQNPLNVRDSTLEVLSDGHTVAPLVKLGYLHAVHGGRTYFMHFHHQSTERDYPQFTGGRFELHLDIGMLKKVNQNLETIIRAGSSIHLNLGLSGVADTMPSNLQHERSASVLG